MEIEQLFVTVRGDPTTMGDAGLEAGLVACARLEAWVNAREATFRAEQLRRQHRPGPAPEPGRASSEPDAAPLPDPTPGPSRREQRRRERRALTLERLPSAAAALERGQMTAEHVAVLVQLHADMRVAVEHAEAVLVGLAVGVRVEEFRRRIADWKLAQHGDSGESDLDRRRQRRAGHVFDTDDGLTGVFAKFDPIWGAEVVKAIEHHADRLWRAERDGEDSIPVPRSRRKTLYADALVEMARRSMAPNGSTDTGVPKPAPPHASVVAVISIERLLGRLHAKGFSELADGTPIPVAEVRKLAAQVGIIPMVMDSDGTVLDMGRRSRTATDDQRLALLVRDGPCADPDCDHTSSGFTHAHHITAWADGGRTDLAELVNQCQTDHHKIHDRGWSIARLEDGRWWLHRPDGTPHKPLDRRRPPPEDQPEDWVAIA